MASTRVPDNESQPIPQTQHLLGSALRQASLPALDPIAEAVAVLANSGIEGRGAIFTRREVVEFILDLVG